MKIVIDIPEAVYDQICREKLDGIMARAIRFGRPLPKRHGRLIDGDELASGCDDPYWCRWLSEIEDAPTIVPAEMEVEDTPTAKVNTPTDQSTDTISRQAAIDEIARWIGYIDEDMILRIQTGLKKVPSAAKNRLQHAIDGKNEEEIYDFLNWLMFEYAKQYTDSRSAVIKWLREGGAERRDHRVGAN